MTSDLSRRAFLGSAGGGLVVSFSMSRRLWAQEQEASVTDPEAELPGSLGDFSTLDSWIRVSPEGEVSVFSGKAELGQGIKTALMMVAAEELAVDPAEIQIFMADTEQTPDEGYTAASHSMEKSGMAIRHAAANVRLLLLEEAARQFNVDVSQLEVADKTVRGPSGSLPYGELARALNLNVEARPDVPFREVGDFSRIGEDFQRVDIPLKVTGAPVYVQDLRPEGMLHARVIRPPGRGSELASFDDRHVKEMQGVVAVIRDGNFLAVVTEREFQAISAMRALEAVAEWTEQEALPAQDRIYDWLRENETEVGTVAEEGSATVPAGDRALRMTFNRPYTMHGSIGPSAAVALMEENELRIWSHTQGVYPDRTAIAEMLGMAEESIRISHVQGSGCYGHNGADDAAADAALIARAIPGRPIRLSWTREQEHGWEPYGSAMTMDVAGAIDESGRITHWTYDLWSCTHVTRPPGANKLLAANLKSDPIPFELPDILIVPPGLGDRNAVPLYTIPNKRILYHFVKPMPIRTSALRALGAHGNVFALESFMDELAHLAEVDPVEFRLRHLDDPRARLVIEKAAEIFGWSSDPLPPYIGRGFAFAQYKNMAAYCAVALTLKVEPETGRVIVRDIAAAVDSGEAVSLDGIRNQIEGGIVQSLSWTLYEEVIFDRSRVTSIDWASYPMLRFASVPDKIDVHVVDRPGEPFLGTGEAAQGPAAAAIGNAIRNATGVRMTTLPLSRSSIVQALGA